MGATADYVDGSHVEGPFGADGFGATLTYLGPDGSARFDGTFEPGVDELPLMAP